MTVKDLKLLLANYDDNDIVIIQKDSEGNDYSPLASIYEGKYKAITSWNGEVYVRELTPELIKLGYTEEDLCEDGENAAILVPKN